MEEAQPEAGRLPARTIVRDVDCHPISHWLGKTWGPLNHKHYCHCCWLHSRTRQQVLVEDTAHFDWRTERNEKAADLETYSLSLFSVPEVVILTARGELLTVLLLLTLPVQWLVTCGCAVIVTHCHGCGYLLSGCIEVLLHGRELIFSMSKPQQKLVAREVSGSKVQGSYCCY